MRKDIFSFLKSYLKYARKNILIFLIFSVVFALSFLLYHLPVKAVMYPVLLCVIAGIVILLTYIKNAYSKHKELERLSRLSAGLIEAFPEKTSVEDEDYVKIIEQLCEEQKRFESDMNKKYCDMTDYYTMWAHQIKTPIASMRLSLQQEDTELSRKLSSELFRIEQYVEMALMFLKLDQSATDYVVKECDLDKIVRQAVRKFSGDFINRKLKLEYEPLGARVLTDEKWLSFVIEQVLSNALKYTVRGTVSISLKAPKTLCVKDTGIGIAPEDLPRIFEKGYTGYNGRNDKRASGIGLYLCRRICRNLGHGIKAESSPDEGTIVMIDLDRRKLETE